VRAGLKAIYLSGWQVAGDANLSGQNLPRPEPVPGQLGCRRSCAGSTNALMRADQIAKVEGDRSVENWLVPIVADGEAGFGGALNVYELQKAMIAAGRRGGRTGRTSSPRRRSAATSVARWLIPDPSSTSAP